MSKPLQFNEDGFAAMIKAQQSFNPILTSQGTHKLVTAEAKNFPYYNFYRGVYHSTTPHVAPRTGGWVRKVKK